MTSPSNLPQSQPHDDPLDALLAARAVRPRSDFAERTLARIASESEAADPALDALLASLPVAPTPGFADRAVASVVVARRRRTILRFSAPLAAAACVAIAALPAVFAPHRSVSTSDHVAAAINADAELRALAALPAAKSSGESLKPEDLATLAELGSVFAEDTNDYAL